MKDKVRNYMDKWQMLQSEDCVIVGVSGGADSICLLLLLSQLQKTIGFRMVAVHVNHGLRGLDADADEAYVKKFCEKLGVICEIYSADVELISKKRKQSTEEAGREVRREFFEKTMKKYGGTKIALAHHQNDSAETFFINLARGTGIRGLGGIAPVNGNVIRPLLCLKREEIEDYLKQEGISYCTDDTNHSDEYTRNRIRNHTIPYLQEQVNPKVVEHMNDTMEQIRQVQGFLDEQVQVYWDKSVSAAATGYLISEEAYLQVPEVLKALLIRRVLTAVSGKEKDLESVHVRQLQELFQKQVGRKTDLPYQMKGRRVYEGILVFVKENHSKQILEEVVFDIHDEEAKFQIGKKQIFCRVTDEYVEKSHTKLFNCDIIKNNISIRTRRQGDYITIHEDGRTQKLKSYFINEKIPREERDEILLVAEGSHVLWIVGYRTNPVYEVKTNTKRVLTIQIDEGDRDGREN